MACFGSQAGFSECAHGRMGPSDRPCTSVVVTTSFSVQVETSSIVFNLPRLKTGRRRTHGEGGNALIARISVGLERNFLFELVFLKGQRIFPDESGVPRMEGEEILFSGVGHKGGIGTLELKGVLAKSGAG